ncbi:MAG: AAA family ATPase [Ignisphaera sp.]|uniref:AAA family ATPase n=1 Tax=Thermofilum sp. TaxID=1961369 RepID=UPI00316346AB
MRWFEIETRHIRIGWFKSRSMGTIHVATLDLDTGEVFCTCPGFLYQGKCWHVKALNHKSLIQGDVDMSTFRIRDLLAVSKPYKSSVESLNKLFGGYAYSSTEITAVYGLPNVGKTLLATQEAFWMSSQGLNVLYIDTEGSLATAVNTWKDRFIKRFGELKGEIYVKVIPSLESLMRYFGYSVDIVLKGSKVEAVVESIKGEAEIEKEVKSNKVSFVILDSVSAPFRNRFPSAQQNFPARADLTAMMYSKLMELSVDGVASLTIHHASLNPANPYDTTPDMRGGIVTQYYSKRVVYMDKRGKKGLEDVRRFWLVRAPNAREWSVVTFARIDDQQGFIEAEFNPDYLTEGEKQRVMMAELEEAPPDSLQSKRRARK